MPDLPKEFDIKKYDYGRYEWYAPSFVFFQFRHLLRYYPEAENHYLFQKAVEAMQASITVLGTRSLSDENAGVIQMNRQSRRPDVIVGSHAKVDGIPTLKITPVEVTAFEDHTQHSDIRKFLLEGKLTKDYPQNYMIVCMVHKILSTTLHPLAAEVQKTGKKNPVYVVGKVRGKDSKSFVISSLQPPVVSKEFDLVEQAKNYPFHFRVTFKKDLENMNPVPVPMKAMPVDLFDFFMLERDRIAKKLGNRGI